MTARKGLDPLPALHELGLLPLVKKVQFPRVEYQRHWGAPEIFGSEGMRHFSALANVQDLVIAGLDMHTFAPGVTVENYFGHFSPTLRSIVLSELRGPPQKLLDLLGLFPKLDDIKILCYNSGVEAHNTVFTERAQIRGSLRGKLEFDRSLNQPLLKEIIPLFGGMRFTSMDLGSVEGVQLLLDACAETLQTLCFRPICLLRSGKIFPEEYGTASELK